MFPWNRFYYLWKLLEGECSGAVSIENEKAEKTIKKNAWTCLQVVSGTTISGITWTGVLVRADNLFDFF